MFFNTVKLVIYQSNTVKLTSQVLYFRIMRADRHTKQLAHLEEIHRRSTQRLEAQRARIDQRFNHARQRIMANEGDPSDEQQRIIAAALELLDEVGLDDLSLRKLAMKLDLKAPALYWHFKNKRELIDYMAEAIIYSKFANLLEPKENQSWQDWIKAVAHDYRDAMLSYRDGGMVMVGVNPRRAKTYAKLSAHTLNVLCDHYDLDIVTAGNLTVAVFLFTSGSVIEEQNSPSIEEIQETGPAAMEYLVPKVKNELIEAMKRHVKEQEYFDSVLDLIISGTERKGKI